VTPSAWDSLLTRARARRACLCGDPPGYEPEPAPALDLVIDALAASQRSRLVSLSAAFEEPLRELLRIALYAALRAEVLAGWSGELWARQLVDDALSFAVRVAGRIIKRMDAVPADEREYA
jgi:hypothetical protein